MHFLIYYSEPEIAGFTRDAAPQLANARHILFSNAPYTTLLSVVGIIHFSRDHGKQYMRSPNVLKAKS